MPKERRTRSKSRASPFPCSSSSYQRHSSSSSSSRNRPESSVAADKDIKEWEEVRCPVCMEHPHNAVLLLCSAHDKGCRPFMCDTSYRHSNCLDQYRKSFSASSSMQEYDVHHQPTKLSCPLCRGPVSGWTVMEAARKYMNAIARSCSLESCGFVGAYGELRKHARKEHPSVRPSEADPERQRDWRRMEQQRDIGDLFSTMQSAIGGEESGVGDLDDEDDLGSMLRMPPPFMLFLVLRVSLPGSTGSGRSFLRIPRGSSRSTSRSRRGRPGILWGESYSEPESAGRAHGDGEDGEEDENRDAESEEAPPASRHVQARPRRQLRMSDDDEDDQDNINDDEGGGGGGDDGYI